MNAIVDTNIWIEFFKGKSLPMVEEILQNGQVLITPIIASELLSGARHLKEDNQITEWVSTLPVTGISMEHWLNVGRLRAKLMKKGLTISTPDAHIAQAALETKSILYSYDSIFKKISNLTDLNYRDL